MRKLLLIPILVLVLVVVGCGGQSGAGDSQDATSDTATDSQVAESQAVEHTPFARGGHCVVVLANNGYDVAQSARDCSEEALVQLGQQSPDWGQFTDGAYAAVTCIFQRGVGQCDPYDYGY